MRRDDSIRGVRSEIEVRTQRQGDSEECEERECIYDVKWWSMGEVAGLEMVEGYEAEAILISEESN